MNDRDNDLERNRDKFDALLGHAMQRAPMPSPPPDFARVMAGMVEDHAEEAGFERWLLRVLLFVAAFAAALLALPVMDAVAGRVIERLDGAPWPLLLTVAAVLGSMKLAEFSRSPGLPAAR